MITSRSLSNRQPRGFTLVEVVTVVTLTSIMIAIAVASINGLMQIEQTGRRKIVEAGTADGLARSFRADVHAATLLDPASTEASVLTLTLTRPDGVSVKYEIGSTEVKRTETRKGSEPKRSNFRMPKRTKIGFEIASDQGLTVVGLSYNREAASLPETHSSAFRADCVLGRDHRFEEVK